MSTTITLEEALKRATNGPLKKRGSSRKLEGGDGRLVCQFPFYSQLEDKTKVNMALLTHCYNVLPEVVAALKWTHDAVLTMQGNNGIPRHVAKSISDHIAPILAKSTTVTLP